MKLVVRRLLSVTVIVCMVFASGALVGNNDTYAASKAKVKKVSFSKKNLDVTLDTKKTKLTVTLNKKVKGAKCAYITLKNGKSKQEIYTRSIKSKKVTASIIGDTTTHGNTLGPGKWKVVKVVLKKGKSEKKWQPGYWSGGKWFSGYYYTSFKVGKTVATAKTKNKATLKVNAGNPTSTTVVVPESAEIGSTQTFSANVKNYNNGASVSSGTVKFTIKNKSSVVGTFAANVNSSGQAQISYTIPKPYDSYSPYIYVKAEYLGTAGKYRRSSSEKSIQATNPVVVMSDGKFYKSGTNYIVEVTLKNSKTGAPVANEIVSVLLRNSSGQSLINLSHLPDDTRSGTDGKVKWTVDGLWKIASVNEADCKAYFTVRASNHTVGNQGFSVPFGTN